MVVSESNTNYDILRINTTLINNQTDTQVVTIQSANIAPLTNVRDMLARLCDREFFWSNSSSTTIKLEKFGPKMS